MAEGWWQRSFSGKFLNNLLNGQFYTIKAVADISGVQVRGVRLIHEIGSCGIGLVTGRFFVFHGQGVPRFAVARIGSEVMEKGGGLYSFEWVDAVASVFQLISLVGKLSGVLMRYVIRAGPDVFISMGAEVGRWGYLQYNQALVFPVAASALFSYLLS